jgi:hypothetical protein
MPTIAERLGRAGRDDLLGCFSFRVVPSRRARANAESLEKEALERFPDLVPQLELDLKERLEMLLDMRVEVIVYLRRGTFGILALVVGTYTVLKDYKTLRDSLKTLSKDVVEPFVTDDLGLKDRDVEATVWTPGTPGQEVLVSGARVDFGSRYAFIYMMISNILLIVFLGLLLVLTLSPLDLLSF